MPVSTRANGNVAAWQEASIGTEANGLRLAEVRVNVGDVVKRGQVLATFAPESMQVDLLQTRAAVAEAEATLGDAAANAERAKALRATGALSEATINQYVTAERTARARLDAQRAALQARQLKVGADRRRRARRRRHLVAQRDRRRRPAGRPGAVPPDPPGPARVARRGRRRPTWRSIKPGTRATVTPRERRADRRHGAHGRADGRPADPQRHRLCRPARAAAARAPACSRAASSRSAARPR